MVGSYVGFKVGLFVGCFVGLRTSGGTQGVGNSTTRAVVISSVLVLAFDFILTKMLWIFENAFRAGDL